MDETARNFMDQFNSIIEDCENFCCMTRDSDLQRGACAKLQELNRNCKTFKAQAVASGDENLANLLLGFECVADCLISEITMWLLLKAEKPDEAWDQLVSAQMAASAAARAHRGFEHLIEQATRLEAIEQLVFPPQVFVSTGFIVQHQGCSICGSEYGDCEHLAGKPYWGKFCCIIAGDMEVSHVAVVKNPADKTCRIVHFTDDSGERNRMTWKVEPAKSGAAAKEGDPIAEHVGTEEVLPRKPLHATARLVRSAT